MADVKWIKITTDMFDNRKIKHLRKLPEGNSIVLIWIMLLTLAGRCNAGGMIFLTENIPYDTKMLADELDFEENTVKLALEALSRFGMIIMGDDGLMVTGWAEHQNVDGMEKIREQNRIRVAEYRKKQKALSQNSCNVTGNITVTQCNALDIEGEKEYRLRDNTSSGEDDSHTDVRRIMDAWNQLSVPHITRISGKRHTMLCARIREYSAEEVIQAIGKIEQSSFLKGEKGFVASFDWFIKPNNFPKVLEGNYDDRESGGQIKPNKQAIYGSGELGSSELEAIKRMMQAPQSREDAVCAK